MFCQQNKEAKMAEEIKRQENEKIVMTMLKVDEVETGKEAVGADVKKD